jgi:glycosyltransferase involved in cell wall biosynthesis
MRILQIVNLGYPAGGAEKSVKLIRDALRERGHEVLVISSDKQLEGKVAFADITIPMIAGGSVRRLLRHAWYGVARREIQAAVQHFRPDVVHLHTIGEFSPAAFWAAGSAPAALSVHGPEEYTLELLPWQLPASDYRNRSFEWSDLTLAGHLRYWYYRLLQRPLFLLGARRLRVIFAPSKFMAQALESDAGKIPVRHLYNGIELPAPAPMPDKPCVLYVGRLESVKGVDVLIRAMEDVATVIPSAQLLVVGDGSERQSLQQLSERLGLADHITFAGWLPPAGVRNSYRAAQVVAIPSVWPENLPTVAIEALATGRPIVGSDIGGIPELIVDGLTGMLVEPRDSGALASCLAEVLSDTALANRMARAAYEASGAFSITTFVESLEAAYEELAAMP